MPSVNSIRETLVFNGLTTLLWIEANEKANLEVLSAHHHQGVELAEKWFHIPAAWGFSQHMQSPSSKSSGFNLKALDDSLKKKNS